MRCAVFVLISCLKYGNAEQVCPVPSLLLSLGASLHSSDTEGQSQTLKRILVAFVKLLKATDYVSQVCPSLRSNSAPTGRIFMKFRIRVFYEHWQGNAGLMKTPHKNDGLFIREDQHAFLFISRSVLRRTRNVYKMKVVEKIKTHILWYKIVQNRGRQRNSMLL